MQMEAKYDKTLEAGVKAWIEKTTGESIGEEFQAGLKSGVILAKCVVVWLCGCVVECGGIY